MSIISSFQRNARAFANYLGSLLTRTIAPNHALTCQFLEGNQARITFQRGYAPLGRRCLIRVVQRIAPNPDDRRKVTTLEYSYAFIIGTDPDAEPFVRYDYVPKAAADSTYRYPIGHMHIHAISDSYEAYMTPYEHKPLKSVHFPAGRIAIEDFIELLIVEFHVPVVQQDPQAAIRLLRESRATFLKEKRTKH